MEMARRCVPFTPPWKPLADMTVTIVSTAGVHLADQAPFDTRGDTSWREIPGDADTARFTITHGAPEDHYDRSEARQDINVIFPLDRLRELAAAGMIAGVANRHFSLMGYAMRLRQFYDQAAPAVAREVERTGADAAVLTAG